MPPAIPPLNNITADTVTRFLTGASVQSVRAHTGLAFDEIYRILQARSRLAGIFLQFRACLRLPKKAADDSKTNGDMRYRYHLGSSTRIVRLRASQITPESMRTG
jgi:hypothetical protein